MHQKSLKDTSKSVPRSTLVRNGIGHKNSYNNNQKLRDMLENNPSIKYMNGNRIAAPIPHTYTDKQFNRGYNGGQSSNIGRTGLANLQNETRS